MKNKISAANEMFVKLKQSKLKVNSCKAVTADDLPSIAHSTLLFCQPPKTTIFSQGRDQLS